MLSFEFTLINYPPSITTEKVRWVFRHYGIPFVEKRMTLSPGFLFAVLRHFPRFRKSPPFAIDSANGLYLREPDDIVDYFDRRMDGGRRLVLSSEEQNEDEVSSIKQAIKLAGQHIRPWAYSYITPNKNLFLDSISAGAPESQKQFVRMIYPLIARLTRNSLSPDSEKLPAHYQGLVKAFDIIDGVLADGRAFLQGKRLSVFDIYFCVHAAPCVMPAYYAGGGVLPDVEHLPPRMKPLVQAFRERPAGKFVLQMYDSHRLV